MGQVRAAQKAIHVPQRLIINADDYGRCVDVNLAIEELALAGKLGGISVLPNTERSEHAIEFLSAHPQLSAGAHLNVLEGQPLSVSPRIKAITDANNAFVGLAALMGRWALHPVDVACAVELEWRAQIERLQRAGIAITHADTHRHLHAFPPAYKCLMKLCHEYAIPAYRWPAENGAWAKRPLGFVAMRSALTLASITAANDGLCRNDHMLGFGRGAGYDVAALIQDLGKLGEGVTELVVHPSMRDGYPYSVLCGNRERQALLDPAVPARIADLGIQLTTWAQLTHGEHAN